MVEAIAFPYDYGMDRTYYNPPSNSVKNHFQTKNKSKNPTFFCSAWLQSGPGDYLHFKELATQVWGLLRV